MRTRLLQPHDRNHRRFTGGGVLASGLAKLLGRPFRIQNIIGDLESGAQIPAEGRDIVPLLRRGAAQDRACTG